MMKRMSARAAAAAIACASVMGMLPLQASAEDAKQLLVLGDSISAGYAVEEGQYGYYDYLTQCEGYEMTNLAVSGYLTTDLLTLMAEEDTKSAIAAADVISVSIGANDLMSPFLKYLNSIMNEGETYQELFDRLNAEGSLVSHVSKLSGYVRPYINTAKSNVAEIEAQIFALNPDVTLVMQTIYNPVEYDESTIAGTEFESSYNLLKNYVRNSTNMINDAIRALEKAKIAEVSLAFEGAGWIYIRVREQDVHPTQLGHALIGATVLNTMGITEGSTLAMRRTLDGITEEDAAVLPADDLAVMEPFAGEYYLRGDANHNGVIDSVDAILALQQYNSAVLMGEGDILDPFGVFAIDVDQNGVLETVDAVGILQFYNRHSFVDPDTDWDDIYPA